MGGRRCDCCCGIFISSSHVSTAVSGGGDMWSMFYYSTKNPFRKFTVLGSTLSFTSFDLDGREGDPQVLRSWRGFPPRGQGCQWYTPLRESQPSLPERMHRSQFSHHTWPAIRTIWILYSASDLWM